MRLREKYEKMMELFEEIRQEVEIKDPMEYQRWKAYGFELDDTFVSMGPNLGEIVESLDSDEPEDEYDEEDENFLR